MEIRNDGRVYWNDQISEITDPILFLVGLKKSYQEEGRRAWIEKISDDGLKCAVSSFTEIQLRIVELIVFEDRSVPDILNVTNITLKVLNSEIYLMHDALLHYL